jgi:hypothetical protein
MAATFICTTCKKIDYGDGTWSELNEGSPKDVATTLCPDCCHERFPQFYSDYEEPKERFRKIFSGLFNSKSKR